MATQAKKARKINIGEPVDQQEDENSAPLGMDTTSRPDKAKVSETVSSSKLLVAQ